MNNFYWHTWVVAAKVEIRVMQKSLSSGITFINNVFSDTRVIDAPVRAQNSLRGLLIPVIRFDYRKNRISAWLSRNIHACRQGDFCVQLTQRESTSRKPKRITYRFPVVYRGTSTRITCLSNYRQGLHVRSRARVSHLIRVVAVP